MALSGKEKKPAPSLSIAARLEKAGKIGFGTMTHQEGARWVARVMLFDRMEKMMSDYLLRLKATALSHYTALYELGRNTTPIHTSNVPALTIHERLPDGGEHFRAHYVTDWSSLCEAADHFDEAGLLASAVSDWAERMHMGIGWFLDAIVTNLFGWRAQPEGLGWSYPGSYMELQHGHRVGGGDMRNIHGWGGLDRVVPAPTVRPYNPSTQTRQEHLADLQLDLNKYYEQQEGTFAKAGFQPTTQKRKRSGNSPWLHFEWFIQYQMQERTGAEIAEAQGLKGSGEDAVSKALRDLAELLPVTLRPRVGASPT
jgi:hypothetical protein